MEEGTLISVSDLLRLSSPLSGASSLHSPTSSSPRPLKKRKTLTNPNPKTFSPFNHPVLLVGTVDLPSPHGSCEGHCFSFSDGPSRVCCSLLDLRDLSFIGKEIHVLAWNFLPFKHEKGGVLEIIRWISPPVLQINPTIKPSFSAPLKSHRLTAIGALKSVSPIFSVHCRNSGSSGDSIGFLAELVTCSCNLCSNHDPKNPLLEQSSHSFANSNFVYFLKPASKWRPVLNMLVGKLVVISGLKRKLIFVGEKASYEMFLTMETTVVSLCQLPLRLESIWKNEGVYSGVVTGVYMHGMAVELDQKVWLLVTDPKIAPPHSVRVGAIISVRNFHLVRPRFSWIQMHLLGACARTSIDVKSFSFPDTRSYVRTESRSMLHRFMETLTLSAKFWLLLLISCFRRKFAKVLSDKEILGSKNVRQAFARCQQQEGLAQVYASGYLDSHFFQSQHRQHGIFKEFSKHGHCTCENESSMSSFKLVTPISNLISKCEALWASKVSKTQCDTETIKRDDCGKHFTSKTNSCCCTIRRFISSEDLGFILMGSLKVSSSGRLLLADATGSIDVVIPDLLSNIDCQSIYEVQNYKLIMEGSPVQLGYMGFHSIEAFSCRNIFEQFPLKKGLHHLTVYVLFYLRDSTCLDVPLRHPCCKFGNDAISVTGETTQLLLVTHKFLATENFQGDPIQGDQLMSHNSILYAEAVVLPYKLLLQEDSDDNLLANVSLGKLQEESTYVDHRGWLERPKSFELRSRTILDYSKSNSGQLKQKLNKIPCLITFRNTDGQGSPVSGYLCDIENTAMGNITGKQREQRILLEFKSDSFLKYQSIQLGGYYILKCSNRGQCNTVVGYKMKHGKISITHEMTFWSLSFSFGEIMHQAGSSQDHSSGVSSYRVSEACVGDVSQGNVILQESLSQMHRNTDIHIHLFSEMKDIFSTSPGEVLSVSSCIQIMEAGVGRTSSAADPQCRAMPQGNLISLYGDIEKIQIFNCHPRPYATSKNSDSLDTDQTAGFNIVIHVHDDHNKVQIHCYISKHAYPVGMGPGANATFHRVLLTCPSVGCPRLLLTPVSFVVINSIKETGHQHGGKRTPLQTESNVSVESSGIVLGLFSQLTQCMDSKLKRFNVRVVTVYVLVLESTHAPSKFRSKKQLKLPAFNITLAGFILDDGSSLSCCWANAGTAERLLRLHEVAQRPFFHSHRSTMKVEVKGSQDTAGYHLERMLKKHHKVIVKNNRVSHDSYTLGFTFIVHSGKVFSCSDERLLRLIMLNACVGSAFNVMGTVMDSNGLQLLDAELKELRIGVLPLPNLWITDADSLNPLKEARNILHDYS